MSVVDQEKGLAQLRRVAIAPEQLQDQQIALSAQQQHYLGRVLRLRTGDHFIAMDGAGHWWLSELQAGQAQVLEVISAQTELPVPITLIAAPPKGNGFEEVVRQATELGVSQVVPILSDRTLAHPSPQKLERWRRIAQEAAEQSERQVVPQVLDPVPFPQGLAAQSGGDASPCQRYFCVTRYDAPHLLHRLQRVTQSAIVVATGPEGGWTATEVNQAIAAGYQPVSLGRRILRTVTAPLTALSLVAARLEFAQAVEGMQ